MQLEPLEQFVLARGLEDHQDSNIYYVQAVIRNGKTDALIATVNLTDNGDRRFTKTWQVPSDPTGEGFYIVVTYTVYTDSGYTTKSELYGEKFDEHLILHRPREHGGAGGADIDYKKVRRIVQEELASLPKPEPAKDFSPLSDALQAILSEVRAIDIPTPEKVTFTPLMSRFDTLEKAVKQAISDKEVTPEPDLQPIVDAIAALKDGLQPNMAGFQGKLDSLFSRIQEFFAKDIEQIKGDVSGLNATVARIPYLILNPTEQPKPQENLNYDELLKS